MLDELVSRGIINNQIGNSISIPTFEMSIIIVREINEIQAKYDDDIKYYAIDQ